MSLLQWKPSYILGIPSIDHEHRQMIELINAVYDEMSGSAHADVIEAGLENIYAGIAAHFALEELHMIDARYEEYEAHKESHEELLDQIRELMDTFALDPDSGREKLQKSLADWFGIHFATYDARLHHSLGDYA